MPEIQHERAATQTVVVPAVHNALAEPLGHARSATLRTALQEQADHFTRLLAQRPRANREHPYPIRSNPNAPYWRCRLLELLDVTEHYLDTSARHALKNQIRRRLERES